PSLPHTLYLHDALPISSSTESIRAGPPHQEAGPYFFIAWQCPRLPSPVERPRCQNAADAGSPIDTWARNRRATGFATARSGSIRSEEHTSELQSPDHLV